ncbi:MAG: hypothetical protein KatS3mg066_2057 [Fischerella sp.]|nr:MAG: hypothetical protein KatS3mg066_2057 [Fischerella sp.]
MDRRLEGKVAIITGSILKMWRCMTKKSRTGLLMHLGVKVWNGMRIS